MSPLRTELLYSYELLQFQPRNVTAEQFVQFAEWCRFDPRLAQIFAQFIQQNFQYYNPIEIWQLNQQTRYPQVFLVLLDIAEIRMKVDQTIPIQWKIWKKCIQANTKPAPMQSFYVALMTINPNRQLQQLKKNLKCFSKWGFYCDEIPISEKNKKLGGTHMPKSERLQILKNILKEKGQITINEYLQALNLKVHRRQAERDLEETQGLRRKGKTKGRVYFVK